MPAIDVERLKAYGRHFADGFTPGQKAITILGVVGVVIAGMWFMRWAGATEYAALYTDLDSEDAGEVVDALESQGVGYRLEDGGRTVLVPRKDVYRIRVDLSAQGLPSGGSDSYALLDQGGITKDEFSKRVDYQRALQGELARTIEEIDSIRAADVKLTIPQDRVFVGGDEDRPTAAVLVDTGTTTLPGETVQAIVHLVSSSVADMSPDDVTVADAQGNVLAAPGRAGDLALGEQNEQRSRFEESLATSLKNLITTSLGPNRAAVTVSADLDFGETKTTTTRFEQPNDIQVPVSESTKTETYTGPGSGAAGVLGPDGTPLATGDQPVDYSNTQAERDFALDRIEETRNEAPGAVERLSVSVLLDSEAVDAGDVQLWEDALAAAAGIDPARGDQLQVQRVAFDQEAREAAAEQLGAASAAQSQTQLLDIVRTVVTLLIVGLVLFLAWRAIKRAEANRVPLRVPLDLRELEAGELALPAAAADAPHAVPPPRVLEPSPIPAEAEVAALIESQPEEVAQTLRSWLADRRS